MGSDNTRKYDIIGDTVNTAKRLESAAGRGEIVMSAPTYRRVLQRLEHVIPRTVKVKGKSEPLQVFAVAA